MRRTLLPPPRSWFTTVAPLVFVLAVNAVKEGYDDVCRHRNDSQINNRIVLMLDEAAGEVPVFWKDVVAGDLIKVRRCAALRCAMQALRCAALRCAAVLACCAVLRCGGLLRRAALRWPAAPCCVCCMCCCRSVLPQAARS